MPDRAEIGAAGEAYVAGRLAREGYDILARNWRARGGELDIVALDGDILVFVEVRVRTGERYVAAEETVNARKLRRVIVAANAFAATCPEHAERVWRIDLVAITLAPSGAVERYRHLQNLTLD